MHRNPRLFSFALFMLILGLCLAQHKASLAAWQAPGATYFVAPTGADDAPGTMERPWRTIQRAIDAAGPGDTVYVRSGSYIESVFLRRSGEPGRPITLAGYRTESVTLDGNCLTPAQRPCGTNAAGIQIDLASARDASDIVIDGLAIQHFAAEGISFPGLNNRLTLRNLIITDNGAAGIRLSNSDGTRVESTLLQRNGGGGFNCTPGLPGEASDPGCTNLYIGDTRALDNGTGSITGVDAFAVERGADILVERSTAGGGAGDGFDFKSDRTTLRRVTAYNTRNNLKLWGKESRIENALAFDAMADGNLVLVAGGSYTVTNVTIANMTGNAYLVVVGDTSGSGATPVTIQNSIFFNNNAAMGGTLLWLGPSVELVRMDRNLYFNPYRTQDVICAELPPYQGECFSDADLNQSTSHPWMEPNSRYADPLFTSPIAKDFSLRPGSPAIDAGTTEGAPTDDAGGRPRDDHPDLGPYEYRPS